MEDVRKRPEPVDLTEVAARFFDLREVAWQMSRARFLNEGCSPEEADRRVAESWLRGSIAHDRRFRRRAAKFRKDRSR